MFFYKLIDLFFIADSISRKSLDFVDEVSKSPAIDSINLSGQEIETINETNKTTVNKPAKQIDKFSSIRK